MPNHRTTESASAPIGQAAATQDLSEDRYLLPIWACSSLLTIFGLAIVAGAGGFFAGLGLAGLFLFLGIVIKVASERTFCRLYRAVAKAPAPSR